MIVDEACANVINHAYKNTSHLNPNIYLTVNKNDEKLEIAVADEGDGFDPENIKTPDMDAYQKNSLNGGLGLHLIQQFSDEVSFEMNPGVRNEVKMVKFLKVCSN